MGSLEVLADGRPLELGGHKQRAMLAVLVLEANRVVSSDHLIDALWEDQPTPTADECDPARAQSIGGPPLLVAFCDGSVRDIRPHVSDMVWAFLCDPSDGNPINADDY